MEITKGYTSQGLGFYLKSLTTSEFCELSGAELPVLKSGWTPELNALQFMRVDAVRLRIRDDWDRYIQKPITKKMFVNEIPHPDSMPVLWSETSEGSPYDKQFDNWEQAESKVIFKGWKVKNNIATFGNWIIQFGSDCHFLSYRTNGSFGSTDTIKTLSDLFTAVKDLELKNVNI